jgi:hypothetical protein
MVRMVTIWGTGKRSVKIRPENRHAIIDSAREWAGAGDSAPAVKKDRYMG